MSELKVGDIVYIDIPKSKLNKIVEDNKNLAYEIMQCYTAPSTEIIRIEREAGYNSEDLFCLKADNGKTAWRENELKSFKADFMGDAIRQLNITSEEASLVYDALVEEGFSSDDIKYLMEDDELRVFKSREKVFDWFFSGELPYFDDIMNSVGRFTVASVDVGMAIEDLVYEKYLNKQENYKKVNDNLYIAWYL